MVAFSQSPGLRGILTSVLVARTALTSATHIPHRKAHLAKRHDSTHITQPGFKTVGYYVSWAIYGRNFLPNEIQTNFLTHINYAFAGIDNQTGEAYLTDPFADIQKIYPGDVSAPNNTDLFGNMKQIYLLKKKNRNLKSMLSIGGWNTRFNMTAGLSTSSGRKNFAKTAVQLLKDYGFDGLDIDWEYPSNTAESGNLVDVCCLIRAELDAYSRNVTGCDKLLLALAVPAGPDNYKWFDMQGLAPYVDFVSLMAYDYQGSGFSNFSGHASNLYKSQTNPKSTDYDTQSPVDYYLHEQGWPSQNFLLGMPIYGRSFANTSGPGTAFTPARDGSWEPGVWDYKALPLNGSQVYQDNHIVASWCYNNLTHYMVTYDDPTIASRKAQYIQNNGMGGAMWWELSADQPIDDDRSLIKTVTDNLAQHGGLEQSPNTLNYPQSQYKNMREGMPGQ